MLDLARSDNELYEQPHSVLDFSALINEEVMNYEAVLFEKGFMMKCDVEEQVKVSGVESQLRQLIGILLDNAGKYADPGSDIHLVLQKCGKKRCRLSVSDKGGPISGQDLKNIFKRFYQADEARTQTGSYGLGLAIAQNIADQHKGRIWAESKDGLNTFYVELPTK